MGTKEAKMMREMTNKETDRDQLQTERRALGDMIKNPEEKEIKMKRWLMRPMERTI